MNYSYNWLKKLSGTKLSPEQLAELLTMRAFEVEGIEKVGGGLDKVVVGKILAIEKHPNADKLQVVRVTTSDKRQEASQVVCGAWNIKVGDKVPVALVGAKLPNGMEIKEAEIRGVKSYGMLCAEDELGLGKDHSGILILEKDDLVGAPVTEALSARDTMMEIKVLPDRSHDALSHMGMSREIAALEGRIFSAKSPKIAAKKSKKLAIKIQDKELCARYMGAVVEDVEIEDSPAWAKVLLKKFGINPISQIVDTTNYVMLELGQPMHAFDLDKLSQKKGQITITIRSARNGEEIKLLDGNVYKLTSEDIVIADGEKAIALAGVMGGADTAITSETRNIVLESANFDATSIRKTRVRLNIITDASIRFEKMIDPNLAEAGILRALEILKNFPGKIEGLNDAYVTRVNPWKIKLSLEYVNKLLGESIPAKAVAKILKSLQLKTTNQKLKTIVKIPTFRLDLKTQEDLIEEIGRIYGYDKIKSQAPHTPIQPARANEARIFEKTAKNILVGKGFSEVYNYSFYSRKDAERAQIDVIKHMELENPLNPEQELLRVSLIPNLLKNVRENLKYGGDIHIFEIGKVYWLARIATQSVAGGPASAVLPNERKMLVGAVVMKTPDQKSKKTIKAEEFYEAKGHTDVLLDYLSIHDRYYDDFNPAQKESFSNLWHRGRSAEIRIEGQAEPLGFIGEINPVILDDFDIQKRVAIFEFDLERLQEASEAEREYQAISKYPEVTRDISMIAAGEVRVDDILENIQAAGGSLVLDADLFDIFDFADGKSSYAFRIIFGSSERTLKSEEIDILMEKISANLEKRLGVAIRK